MKICAYVQKKYAKEAYKNECLDARSFVGLRIVIDAIQRKGYAVEWAGIDSVHEYDIVLVSLTASIDWWPFIQERMKWKKGNYKVFIGGAGVMHVQPFLDFADYFFLGRGEDTVPHMVEMLDGKSGEIPSSVIESKTFDPNKLYYIQQAKCEYPHEIVSEGLKKGYKEDAIGCNHKCLFCGYTWHRKFNSKENYYSQKGGQVDMANRERAILDIVQGKGNVNYKMLRNTAVDGLSERLRYMVNKRIKNEHIIKFFQEMCETEGNGHQIRMYNILGYPTETEEDWYEFKETVIEADKHCRKGGEKKWYIVIHSTPFKPVPASPLACSPISRKNYRGALEKVIGDKFKKHGIYQGQAFDVVSSFSVESVYVQELDAICTRGSEADSENIKKLALTPKFWSADAKSKQKTIEKYFDIDYLFQEFTADTLPSRYLRTFAGVEKMWKRPP